MQVLFEMMRGKGEGLRVVRQVVICYLWLKEKDNVYWLVMEYLGDLQWIIIFRGPYMAK